jgi:hypothetical protein
MTPVANVINILQFAHYDRRTIGALHNSIRTVISTIHLATYVIYDRKMFTTFALGVCASVASFNLVNSSPNVDYC